MDWRYPMIMRVMLKELNVPLDASLRSTWGWRAQALMM
jgi:hypothetical protein